MPNRPRNALLFLLCTGTMAAAAWQAGSPPSSPPATLPELLARAPRYHRGNLHTHSLWSDGDDFPEMIADWYRQHGYDFLALTDHNVLSEGERWVDVTPKMGVALRKYLARFGEHWVRRRVLEGKEQVRLQPLTEFRSVVEEPGRFLLLAGEEISDRCGPAPVHLNAINVRDVVSPVHGDTVTEVVRGNHRAVADQRKRTGWRTLVALNHPNFGWGVRAEDMLAEELRYFEVFNGHPSVNNQGDGTHASCERVWDVVLALRLGKHHLPIVYGLATDDAHGYHAFGLGKVNPGRGWVMVRCRHLTAESIVGALEAGDFYASTGVKLRDVRREGDRLTLRIEGEPGVTYRTEFVATLRDTPLDSEPRRDAEGKALTVTRVYHADVGRVVAESDSLEPSYRLTGKEWYVRARIVSSRAHPNPYARGDVEMAWTQPVTP